MIFLSDNNIEENVSNEFLAKLKELRKNSKLTQQQVADALSVDRTTYTYYETGRRRPNFQIIYKLTKIFNVSASYLFGVETPPDSLQVADVVNSEDVSYADCNSKDERSLLLNFRLLNDESKKKVIEYIKSLDNEGI